jgi:hypothetical protein
LHFVHRTEFETDTTEQHFWGHDRSVTTRNGLLEGGSSCNTGQWSQ